MRIRPPAFATASTPRGARPAEAPLDPVTREALEHCVALLPISSDHPPAPASRRADGWSCERQRIFLEALAEGATVEAAARLVGLSPASAYAFRQRAHGAAFALGWHAAMLLQRQKLADVLTARAFDGQVDTYTRADGTAVTRHRHDNRLALALLTRLDRLAASEGQGDPHGEAQAARVVAGEWQAYLDVIAAEGGPARAGLFLAARAAAVPDAGGGAGAGAGAGADPAAGLDPILSLARADLYLRTGKGAAAEVDVADCDPAARADWTADQWRRAEAAGLVALAPAPPPATEPPSAATDAASVTPGADPARNPQQSQHSPAAPAPVWFDRFHQAWRTTFPAPPGYHPQREMRRDGTCVRALTPAEERVVEGPRRAALAAAEVAAHEARRAWFAARDTAPDLDSTTPPDWLDPAAALPGDDALLH